MASQEEPATKKVKTDEPAAEEAKEEPKKFEEPDAPDDKRAALKENITFQTAEMTLNAIPTLGGKLLMSISEGGMAYLMAGARCNVAQKAGRYMFETKIVQSMNQFHGRTSMPPRQLLRVGFSTAGSTLMLGDDDQSFCFDGDGSYIADKKRQPGPFQFLSDRRRQVGTTIAVVLNLDSKSPNFNTVALYCDGKPMGEPKSIPEGLKGKALHPHVCYRNLSVNVNFGPTIFSPLPFKCRALQSAANADMVVAASKQPKDGKYEVVLPVAAPDEGTFEWLDTFLEKNPDYVELSDRKIMEWARCSGYWSRNDRKNSNDKPSFNYSIPALDDLSVRKLISAVAPIVPRNYVVMEVKSNLLADERKETLKKFSNPCYKKVAHVVVGEPDKAFKAIVQNKLLKEKQAKADIEWRQRKSERERQLQILKKQKEIASQKKEAEEKAKKEAAEKKAKEEAEKKAKEEAEAKEKAEKEAAEGAEKKDEDKKDEEKPAEEKKEEEKPAEEEKKVEEAEETKADEEPEEQPDPIDEQNESPAVELTEDEKKVNFVPGKWPDLASSVMNSSYTNFSIAEKDEGFDDIRFEWESGAKAQEYFKTWITNKKLNIRIEDLKPGQFFTEKNDEFRKTFANWQDLYRKMDPSKKAAPKEGAEEEEEEKDVFTVENIENVGDDIPLFKDFDPEDWALVEMRYQLHMVTTCFKKDCNDPERTGIPLAHVSFYFQKYFNKVLCSQVFGFPEHSGLYEYLKDTVAVKDGLLTPVLDEATEKFDVFVKMVEATRRDRARRIEAGDETARLKYEPQAQRDAERQAANAARDEAARNADNRGPPPPPRAHGSRFGGPVVPPAGGFGKHQGFKGGDKGKGFGKGDFKGGDKGKSKGFGKPY